jgi:hypothetical protein
MICAISPPATSVSPPRSVTMSIGVFVRILDELEQEIGPADDAEVAYYVEQLTQAVAAEGVADVNATPVKRCGPRRGHWYWTRERWR